MSSVTFLYKAFPFSLSLHLKITGLVWCRACNSLSGNQVLLGPFFHVQIVLRKLTAITQESSAKYFAVISGCDYRNDLKLTHREFFLHKGTEVGQRPPAEFVHFILQLQKYLQTNQQIPRREFDSFLSHKKMHRVPVHVSYRYNYSYFYPYLTELLDDKISCLCIKYRDALRRIRQSAFQPLDCSLMTVLYLVCLIRTTQKCKTQFVV